MDDEEFTLVIDQAKYYSFTSDDIERQFSHSDLIEASAASAAFELRNDFDKNILQFMYDNASDSTGLGSSGSAIGVGFDGSDAFTPLNLISRFGRILDENDVPPDGQRFIVAPPAFYEELRAEDSTLIQADTLGDATSIVRNDTLVTSLPIHGFKMYKSTNTGTSAAGVHRFGKVVLAVPPVQFPDYGEL